MLTMCAKHRQRLIWHRNGPAGAVSLGSGDVDAPIHRQYGLPNSQRALLEVDVPPSESQELATTQTDRERTHVQRLRRMVAEDVELLGLGHGERTPLDP